MTKVFKILIIFCFLFFLLTLYFFVGWAPEKKKITWGVNFSQKEAENFGRHPPTTLKGKEYTYWQNNYIALLEDLKVKNIKLITHWDKIEPAKDNFNFNDLDWQIGQAENYQAKIILVIGMKTGRWPECHLPEWAKNLSKKEQQERILKLIREIVLRYKDSNSILAWQVENEPFFPFGECPWKDKNFLKKEIELVKSLDSKRPIIVSDSGEFSLWITAAKLGDIVGTTLHRRVWSKEIRIYVTHHWFRPIYYWRKAQIIKKIFDKEVICVELQAEPWGPELSYNLSLEEQKKSMNLEQFQKNITFAKKTGLDTFYLWGAEWWFWMKEKQGNSAIWEETRKLFSQ